MLNRSDIDKALYRKTLINKLDKRRRALIVLQDRYRHSEFVNLLGVTPTIWLGPHSFTTINNNTSNAEIIRKIRNVTTLARMLKAYTNLANMNFNNSNRPADPLLCSFAAGLFISSGPLVASILNGFPFAYVRNKLFTINDVSAFTKLLIDTQAFIQHPNEAAYSKKLDKSIAQFKFAMNKVLLVNLFSLNKLKLLTNNVTILVTLIPNAYALSIGIWAALFIGISSILIFAIALFAIALSAAIITGGLILAAVLTKRHLPEYRAEKQHFKQQLAAVQDVKTQFAELSKTHGLFKVKKRLAVGEVGMESSLRGGIVV